MPKLVLGWQVDKGLDPYYWTAHEPRPGLQATSDLFSVAPAACAAHTAIIAQSGSGKSYFLGRFVEELALRTLARCLILDPNADFRRLTEVVDETLWTQASYDMSRQRGRLPHEASRAEFATAWESISIRIRGGSGSRDASLTPITIPWLSVSPDFLAENLDPFDRIGIRNCHNFVQIAHDLMNLRAILTAHVTSDYMAGAERLLRQALDSPADFAATVREEWGLSNLGDLAVNGAAIKAILRIENLSSSAVRAAIEQRLADALNTGRSIGESARKFYFGKLGACRATGIVAGDLTVPHLSAEAVPRIDVIDLPSIDESTRLLVVNAVLRAEWEAARRSWESALQQSPADDTRVPLMVIVDEAHNLIPREPRNLAESAVREQFRTFVAEGRKYGVFVVLVSQRPDKVDPMVLAECENRAIMKLSSDTTAALTRDALGLEELSRQSLSACVSFPIGRALMVGPWSKQEPTVILAAARRTQEGGRNLREEYWTSGPVSVGGV